MATDIERLVLSLEANVRRYERELAKATGTADRTMRQIERRVEQSESKIDMAFGRVGGAVRAGIAGVLAGASLGGLNALSDSYTKVQNSLKVTGLEGDKLKDTYRELFDLAQKQGVPLEGLAALYSRAAMSQKALNASSADVVAFSTAVATALRAGSVGAAEADRALAQLGQTLTSGKVQWEELETLVDDAPTILQAAAAGIVEAGGSVDKLIQLVRDGKVSSEAFFRAIIAGTSAVQALADKTSETSSQGIARLKNALTELVGSLGESSGASRTAASALNVVAESVESLTDKIPGAVKALSEYFEELKKAPYFQSLVKSIAASEGGDTPREALVPGAGPARRGLPTDPTGIDQLRKAMKAATKPGAPKPEAGKDTIFDQVWDLDAKARGGKTEAISLKKYPVPGDDKKKAGGGGAKKENDYQRETAAIRERTAALENEATTVGRSEGEIAKSETAFKLLKAAKDANIEVTPKLLADIEATAAAMGDATQKLHEAEEAHRRFEMRAHQLGATLADGFKDAVLEGEKLTAVMGKLLKSLAARGIDSIFDTLFSKGGAGSGLLSSILGIGGSAVGGPSGVGLPDDGGWSDGGYTGDGAKHEPAGVVHRGEYVMDAATVRDVGREDLDAIRAGADLAVGREVVQGDEVARETSEGGRRAVDPMPVRGETDRREIEPNRPGRAASMEESEPRQRSRPMPGYAEGGMVGNRGGYTGGGTKYQPAGIVHRGEYVIDAANVRRIGRRNLDAIRSGKGYAAGGYVSGGGPRLAPMSPPAVRSAARTRGAVRFTNAPVYNITPAAGVTPQQLAAVLEQHERTLNRTFGQRLAAWKEDN